MLEVVQFLFSMIRVFIDATATFTFSLCVLCSLSFINILLEISDILYGFCRFLVLNGHLEWILLNVWAV